MDEASRGGHAARLYGLVGLGDIGVGAAVFAHPPLLGWLLGQDPGSGAAVVTRLLGCAALALGLGWWLARRRPAHRQALQPGLLAYNFGAGVVFLHAAMLAPAPVIPALVGLLHLALGVAAMRVGTKVQ
ncbi:MAG TPA: hypothetical protein PLB41_07875 [Rubrivivax sp.]|nr:hypothetical protein [Rubrivivax sp.]HPO19464.1 hypothetical protein [Rubrivivax sp.]